MARWWMCAPMLGAMAATACNGGYYSAGNADTSDPIEREPGADTNATAGDEDTGFGDDGQADTGDDDGGPKLDISVDETPPVPHEIVVYRGLLDGGFEFAARFPTADDTVGFVALPTTDGQGADLVVAAEPASGTQMRRYTAPVSGGVHTTTEPETFQAWGVGDVDGDGDADVLIADNRWVWAVLATKISLSPSKDFKRSLPADQADARALAVTDLLDDGDADVVLVSGWEALDCGGRPLSITVIRDFTTNDHATSRVDYFDTLGSSAPTSLSVVDLDLDGHRDLVVAAQDSPVTRLDGAGAVFELPVALGLPTQLVSVRARPTHDAFDVVAYTDGTLMARRIEDSGLVDVATAALDEAPSALASFDARPSAAAVAGDGRSVTIYDQVAAELAAAEVLAPEFAGASEIVAIVVADFDGDGNEDFALDVARPSSNSNDDATDGVRTMRLGVLPRCPPP